MGWEGADVCRFFSSWTCSRGNLGQGADVALVCFGSGVIGDVREQVASPGHMCALSKKAVVGSSCVGLLWQGMLCWVLGEMGGRNPRQSLSLFLMRC